MTTDGGGWTVCIVTSSHIFTTLTWRLHGTIVTETGRSDRRVDRLRRRVPRVYTTGNRLR